MTRPGGLFLDVESRGRGERHLVFLHGLGANRYTWRSWEERLGREYRLHLVDLKGFGTADRPRDDFYSPTDLAREVTEFLVASSMQDFGLVGHSMGGGIALAVTSALNAAGKTTPGALILVGAAAYPQTIPNLVHAARLPGAGFAMALTPARVLARLGLKASYHPMHKPTPETVAAYAKGLAGLRARWALRQVASRVVPEDLEELVRAYPRIQCPTLLLWGNQDRVIPRW
ncbi:MAG: alpha/beta fold hydrolase, partial [Gemmatimonadetes bacterium]|nr:alpha/beta fold hydrolase [Gemmatimonadota bacterium]NNM32249.1 alpha/beta fold hydrolase [Gemmatimonadota bacterium]